MRTLKHFFIGLISVVFVGGAVGVGLAPDSQAAFFEKQAFSQAPLVKKWFQKTVCGFRNPGARFVTSKDGKEVCDRTTGNIWEQNPDSANRGTRNWQGAIDFCADLDKGQGKVYELATVQQLVSVLDYTRRNPALTPDVFTGVLSAFYWSASEVAGFTNLAWVVDLVNGDVSGNDKGSFNRVWCARRGKDAHADW